MKSKWSIQKLIYTGMLAAIASALMSLGFSVPLMPPSYGVDFNDVPSIMVLFMFGPTSAAWAEVIKILIKLITVGTNSMYVGELSNLIGAALFALPLWVVYSRMGKSYKAAVTGLATSIVVKTAFACPCNAFITLPLYAKAMSVPPDSVVSMVVSVNPAIANLTTPIVMTTIPFNILKLGLNYFAEYLLYNHLKAVYPALKSVNQHQSEQEWVLRKMLQNMIRNYSELTRLEMEQIDGEETITLTPLGTLEQYRNQAPLGTDDIIARATMEYLKKALEAQDPDFPILIFPVIPMGLSTEHRNFCDSITLKPDTYYHVLYNICVGPAHHDFKELALLVYHGGNAPITRVLSRELKSGLGVSPLILSSDVFSHPDVEAIVLEGNIWDFYGDEMETSAVMAVGLSPVKLETSKPGTPAAFKDNQPLQPYSPVSVGQVSGDRKTAEGKPIGIGGDPSGVTAEKGRIILQTSTNILVSSLLEIRNWRNRSVIYIMARKQRRP